MTTKTKKAKSKATPRKAVAAVAAHPVPRLDPKTPKPTLPILDKGPMIA